MWYFNVFCVCSQNTWKQHVVFKWKDLISRFPVFSGSVETLVRWGVKIKQFWLLIFSVTFLTKIIKICLYVYQSFSKLHVWHFSEKQCITTYMNVAYIRNYYNCKHAYNIYERISDLLRIYCVDVWIAGISEPQRHWAFNNLRTAIFHEDVQVDFLVRRVGSCRRQYDQVFLRAAHVIMQYYWPLSCKR